MANNYTLTAKSVRTLARDHARLSKLPKNLRQRLPSQIGHSDISVPEPLLYAFNDGDEDIPVYACMAVADVVNIDEHGTLQQIVIVEKPSTTFRRHYVVNGGNVLAAGATHRIPTGPYVKVWYDGTNPTLGDGYGPKPGEWKLFKHYPQTACAVRAIDSSNGIMLAAWSLLSAGIGKANGTIANRASGAFSVWAGTDGSEVDITGMDPTGFNRSVALASGDWVEWVYLNGQLEIGKLCS